MPRAFVDTGGRGPRMQASRLAVLWLKLTLIGFFIYVGLFLAGVRRFSWYDLAAIGSVAGAISLLLRMDDAAEAAANENAGVEKMTFAGLIYVLLTRRRTVLVLTLFAAAGSILAAYYIITWLFVVEYQGASGTLVVRLPGQIVYYRPLHPYGWENTQIRLQEKQVFEVEITGRVSPGLLQEAININRYIDKQIAWRTAGAPAGQEPQLPDQLRWNFTGPEGYQESFYQQVKGVVPDYRNDSLLTVRGKPHNQVIGVIVPEGGQACYKNPNVARPCEANDKPSTPGYDVDTDAELLYFLSSPQYPLRIEARRNGVLWLTINDADGLRFDNAGLFFVKITIR
jgi:hypothetical protein